MVHYHIIIIIITSPATRFKNGQFFPVVGTPGSVLRPPLRPSQQHNHQRQQQQLQQQQQPLLLPLLDSLEM